ncbi:hypothetical protein HII31_13037 [Pseudocercospora fuligena]|uniref:Uncharacterized protein n=1 Tax=Pseudocercospora fuligena TaxID=685502 RepID=A0A8H6R877_9PEZI|nr:hypothetical protein HII31_13037 [Pseudocercospora fuligena]
MPGLIHEDFTAQFSDSILARARACLAETQLAPEDEQLLKHLRRSGSPDLEFQPDDDAVYKKQPDGCIWIVDPAINERSTYPAFVMEVAKSENPEHLKIACYNMIVDSQALVKCVVGFALEPNRAARKKEDKTACVGIWRGTSTATAFTVDEPSDELKTFRQADGTPAHGDLRFTIGDFVPEATAAQLSDKSILDRQIIFTLSDLADILRTAEIGRAKLDDTAPRKTGPKRKAMPLPEVYDDLRDPKMRRLEKEAARKEDIEAGESFRKDDGKTAVDSEEPRGRVLATARSKRSSRRSAGLQASASSQRSRDGS